MPEPCLVKLLETFSLKMRQAFSEFSLGSALNRDRQALKWLVMCTGVALVISHSHFLLIPFASFNMPLFYAFTLRILAAILVKIFFDIPKPGNSVLEPNTGKGGVGTCCHNLLPIAHSVCK